MSCCCPPRAELLSHVLDRGSNGSLGLQPKQKKTLGYYAGYWFKPFFHAFPFGRLSLLLKGSSTHKSNIFHFFFQQDFFNQIVCDCSCRPFPRGLCVRLSGSVIKRPLLSWGMRRVLRRAATADLSVILHETLIPVDSHNYRALGG